MPNVSINNSSYSSFMAHSLTRVKTALTLLSLLFIASCSSGGDILDTRGTIVPAAKQRLIPSTEAYAYYPSSPYASVLKDCIVPEEEPCTLDTLPFIGQENLQPTIVDIMDRVLVTHDWMGERFEQILVAMPPETLDLFVPVTAIIIGSEVRPSNYWAAYGRIALDPASLWLSNSEKTTISKQEDFRTNLGSEIKYRSRTTSTIGGKYAWSYFSLSGDKERTLRDIRYPMARLLFHELAHANDFIQASLFPSLNADDTPSSAAVKNYDNSISERLYDASAGLTDLTSPLYDVARTRYAGEPLNAATAAWTAEDAGAEMATEGKAYLYGYSTIYEDVATLFDQAMMKRHFNIDSNLFFFNKPADEENATCRDQFVAWGVTNRAASDLVKFRSKWVMNQMIDNPAAIDNFYANIGQPAPMRIGEAWCDQFSFPNAATRSAATETIDMDAAARHDMMPIRHDAISVGGATRQR